MNISAIGGFKFRSKITIKHAFVFANETGVCTIKIDDFFAAGSTGDDIVITDSSGNIVDKKTIFLDVANSIGEISFPAVYSTAVDSVYYAYWGKPNFAMADTYGMGENCRGYYNMSNDPTLGLLDQSNGLYTVPPSGSWASGDLVAGGLHRCIQSTANSKWFTFTDLTAGYDIIKDHTLRFKFSCADVQRYQYPITSHYLTGFLLKVSLGALTVSTQFYTNAIYTGNITSDTIYDVVLKQNLATKNNQCYVNGELVGEFNNGSMEGQTGYHYIFGDPTGYTLIGKAYHTSMYQEDQSAGLIKTLYNNIANYSGLIGVGAVESVGGGDQSGLSSTFKNNTFKNQPFKGGAFRNRSFR